jgi:putative transposase
LSRKPRPFYPGASFHVTARGNKRAKIFYDTQDYLKYLEILENTRKQYPFTLHSYCLMTNHLHLLIEPPENYLPEIMKAIHMKYAIYLNKKLDIDGHVFQGRYGSQIVLSEKYFLTVSRYIHRNPLEAKMVEKAEDYPWSSYSSYIFKTPNPHIDPTKTYSYFPEPVNEMYRQFVEKEEDKEGNESNPCFSHERIKSGSHI